MNKYILLVLFLLISSTIIGQQIPDFSQSYVNPYIYNPSRAGNTEYTKTFLQYRKQWVGIHGAPETTYFTIDAPIKNKKIGIGLLFFNNITNIIGKTRIMGTYSYHIQIAGSHKLSLGLSTGFCQNKIHFDKIRVQEQNEFSILNNMEAQSKVDADFGLTYNYKKLEVELFVNQLLANDFNFQNQTDFKEMNFQLIPHYGGTFSYNYDIKNSGFSLKPSLMIKSCQGMPLQFNINSTVFYQNNIWMQLSYKQHFGISFSFGSLIYNKLVIGYSYDMSIGNIAKFTDGSHEIVLGYRFYKLGKAPKTKDGFDRKEFEHLKKLNQQQYEVIEELEQENEKLKIKVKENKEDVQSQKQEINKLKEIFEKNKKTLINVINKYKVELNDIDSLNRDSTIENKSTNEYNIIVGAYLKLQDAKLGQKILQREMGLKTQVMEREDGKYFFLYTATVKSKMEILNEFKRIKALNFDENEYGNLWIYKNNKK